MGTERLALLETPSLARVLWQAGTATTCGQVDFCQEWESQRGSDIIRGGMSAVQNKMANKRKAARDINAEVGVDNVLPDGAKRGRKKTEKAGVSPPESQVSTLTTHIGTTDGSGRPGRGLEVARREALHTLPPCGWRTPVDGGAQMWSESATLVCVQTCADCARSMP
jgi:hypothetical protein